MQEDKKVEGKIEEISREKEQSLWASVRVEGKSNFVVGLEGKSTFLWVAAVVMLIIAVIIYLVMPDMTPGVETIELSSSQNMAVAASSNTLYLVEFDHEETVRFVAHDLKSVDGIYIGTNKIFVYDLEADKVQSFSYDGYDQLEPTPPEIIPDNIVETSAIITSNGYTFFLSLDSIVVISKQGEESIIGDASSIRYPSSATKSGDTVWVADFDRIIRIDDAQKAITPFPNDPIKHITVDSGKLTIIYENGNYIKLDDTGKTTEKQKLSSWTNYRKTSISDTEGDTTISANGLLLKIGNTTDSKPSSQIKLKKGEGTE